MRFERGGHYLNKTQPMLSSYIGNQNIGIQCVVRYHVTSARHFKICFVYILDFDWILKESSVGSSMGIDLSLTDQKREHFKNGGERIFITVIPGHLKLKKMFFTISKA